MPFLWRWSAQLLIIEQSELARALPLAKSQLVEQFRGREGSLDWGGAIYVDVAACTNIVPKS